MPFRKWIFEDGGQNILMNEFTIGFLLFPPFGGTGIPEGNLFLRRALHLWQALYSLEGIIKKRIP